MGVVYRAFDLRLDRDVAIKVLAPGSLVIPDERERFFREAKAAARLSHPNIAVVHEIDEAVLPEASPGSVTTPFIAMEYLDGESLAELVRRGPVPIDTAICIGKEIASGLQAAHAAGVVHRDIKSSNVIRTGSGITKILDFGLALLGDQTRITRTGSTVGTVAYMSPEQARGEPVDARTDLYSLGVVLYEMVAGRPPFVAEYEQAVVYRLLNEDPEPLSSLRSGVPPDLERIVQKCLEKEPSARYAAAADLRIDLERVTSHEQIQSMRPAARRGATYRRRGARVLAGTLFALLAYSAYAWVNWRSSRTGAGDNDPIVQRQLTYDGFVIAAALSPDGQFLAYATISDGGTRILVTDVAGGRPIELIGGMDRVFTLEWSPGSDELLVSGDGNGFPVHDLQPVILPRLGGSARPLRALSHGRWFPGGTRIASAVFNSKAILLTDVASGDTSSVQVTGDYDFLDIGSISPNEKWVAVTLQRGARFEVHVVGLQQTFQSEVFSTGDQLSYPRWSRTGDALYVIEGTQDLWRVPVNSTAGTRTSEPELLLSGLSAQQYRNLSRFQVSTTDDAAVYVRRSLRSNLRVLDRDRTGAYSARPILPDGVPRRNPVVSHDGGKVAYLEMGTEGVENVFVVPMDGGEPVQLTFLEKSPLNFTWSPSGDRMAVVTADGALFTVPSNGGTPRWYRDAGASEDLAWAPDGRILFQTLGNSNLAYLDPDTGTIRRILDATTVGFVFSPRFSPDGRRLAVHWNQERGRGTWVMDANGASARQVATHILPQEWTADGSGIYVLEEGTRNLLLLNVEDGSSRRVTELPFGCELGYVSTTADRLVCAMDESTSDVWILENFDPHVPPSGQ